jgi:hypothetical protein
MREFARLRALPDRASIAPEELDDYELVVARTALRYSEYELPRAYFGAIANAPVLAGALVRLGRLVREGQLRGAYSDADRELVDLALSKDLGFNAILTVHAPDALAVGVRPEAMKAIWEGSEESLTPDEAQVVDYARAVVAGEVTDQLHEGMVDRLGDRGALEFTIFVGFLLMTFRLWQAVGVPDPTDEEIGALIDDLVAGRVELPEADARIG